MLNGDAHLSTRRDGELRIGRCRVLKDQNVQRITERHYRTAVTFALQAIKSILVAQLAMYSKLLPNS
jgi:hypothetical protein